ncbi:hypothetical protein [Rubrivirga sp.]|uniref:hypothetical protein n=1 Tax=Rubrivirga sp. TaxID=1885344 RepID=UPI003B518480
MHRFVLAGLLLAAGAAAPTAAQTNPTHDQTMTWRTYAATRQARVRVFLADDERRPRTVVVDDQASNAGAITDEAQFLADLVGRELGFDPAEATFVFRFTPASFVADAPERGKTLLLRALFRRSPSGALGAPTWRILSSDELAEMTDRALR